MQDIPRPHALAVCVFLAIFSDFNFKATFCSTAFPELCDWVRELIGIGAQWRSWVALGWITCGTLRSLLANADA
jgi:hypothetical protein